jgi:peptide/nickel transport system substrate-binding protein
LISCNGPTPKTRTPADTLVVGLETGPLTLDPRLASDAYSTKISALLHNGLFRLNERLEAVPDLAEKFELLSPTKYRFHLRRGVLFHDGRPLTAEDVKFTLESILDPALASPFHGTMEKIAAIRILDPLTLEISLKEPFAPFLQALTIGIVPKGVKEKEDPTIGTGPFRLESFRSSEETVLKRNEKYFRTVPKMEKIVFKVVPDDNLRLLELKNGRIDLLQNNIPPSLLQTLREDKGLVFETTEGINFSYLGMNLRSAPLNKLEVRRAIASALDLPAIIEYRMANMARPATGLLAPIHWAYSSAVSVYPYNPKKARALLDQAGYPDPDGGGPAPRFSLTYKTSTKKDRIGLARLIARYLKEVGIEVKVLPFEWGTFYHDINSGNFELYSLTWVGVTEPDIYYYAFHKAQVPPNGANRGAYANPVVDQLTEVGRKTSDRFERKKIYEEVQKILADDLPIIPLWYEDNFAVFAKRVKGMRLWPNASFEWATEVYKE